MSLLIALPNVSEPPCGKQLEPLCSGGLWPELAPRRMNQWIWALLALGVAARLVRYLLRFPLWCDEAYLSVNLLQRGYLELLNPLEYQQVAPVGFLWVQLSLVRLLGFSEYSLRLFSLLAGLASLPLFYHLASRLLRGTASLMAVGIFCVSYPCIRYSAEAKPYGSDLFVSLVLLALAVAYLQAKERRGLLWLLAAVVPLAVWLSYPAVFVAGAVSAAIGYGIWRGGCRRAWLAWVVYNLLLGASFAGLYQLSTSRQTASALEFSQSFWHDAFPPLTAPAKLLGWLWTAHSGDMLAYPIGGRNSGSTLTLLCCLLAIIWLVRRRQLAVLLLCLGPFALNFVAAAMGRYPYGGHVRIAMFLAPVVCLLAGLGLALAVERLSARRSGSVLPVATVAAVLMILAAGSIARDLARPYRSESDRYMREFARWFWDVKALDAELVCLKTDLAEEFYPWHPLGDDSAMYLCNQRIYSQRHARHEPPCLDRTSASRPLRCVRFWSTRHQQDDAAWEQWLAQMHRRYALSGRERYPFPIRTRDGRVAYTQVVEVYEFVPADQGLLVRRS